MKRLFVGLIALSCLLGTLSSKVMAQSEPRLIAFMALRMGDKMRTNGDVIDYIIASKMTDSTKQDLFKQADQNFNQYKELERNWAQEKFDIGLKQMAYFELLKKHYLKGLRRNERRQFFNATENAWYKRVEEEESRVLKHLLDQRLGIVKSREQFGTWLKEQNYPHSHTESGTDVYFRWFDALKARLKIEMQMEEIKEYEIAMAVKQNNGRIDPSPTDIWNLNERSQKLISEHLDGKNLNQQELDQVSMNHPDILVMVKDIKHLSLSYSKLSELEALELTAPKITDARNALSQSLRAKGVDGLLKYIDIATQLREKYKSSEELISLSRAALNRFMEAGDFNEYMIGRLYKLAAKLDDNTKAPHIKTTLAQALPSAMLEASAFQKDDRTFEQAVYDDVLAALPKNDDLIEEASTLMAWVIKFEAKKIALQDQSVMHVERFEYRSSEAYDRLSNHIKLTRLQNGLKQFREREVRNIVWAIELSNGSDYFMDDRAYNFLMN
ncbi:MAG: hypothetical protein CME71_07905 [Halobacteriovorax sp.]|nr:hypothetical protein [Halobacteriovorax sp.]